MTSKEYLILYPNSKLYTEEDGKNTSKSSGLHMKTEKYKQMFSERFIGERNPNHKSNTTEDERKEKSPFSVNFYLKRGLSETESEENITEIKKRVHEIKIEKCSESTTIGYWLKLGYSDEEALYQLQQRQSTFSLKICIKKYGELEGTKRWLKRQSKWMHSLRANENLKNFSSISQELFWNVLYRYDDKESVYFHTKNCEFSLVGTNNVFAYDFTDIHKKRIIEYNGDVYHGNPIKFTKDAHPNPFKRELTAEDIWIKDKIKIDLANKYGYDVLIIWESEYNKKTSTDKKLKIEEQCLNFLLV